MEIYNTVPEKALEEMPDKDRFRILDLLKANKEQFIYAKVIAEKCNYHTKGTQIEVRKAIAQLIEIDLQPIVSNAFGFAYTENPDRLKHYINCLEDRKQGMQRRIDKLSEIVGNFYYEGEHH